MCQSQAEGGRRCAAHTRPAYRKAVDEVLDACTSHRARSARESGYASVVAHAMTTAGRVEVEADVERVYRQRGEYVDGVGTARWLLMCAYEADESRSRSDGGVGGAA